MPLPNSQQLFQDFSGSLDAFRNSATSYVIALSAIGVTAMALIQTVKDQTPLRASYQRRRLRKWIAEGLSDFQAGYTSIPGDIGVFGK